MSARALALALLAALVLPVHAFAQKHDCRASREMLDLGNPLEIARTGVSESRELRIVAMGSSSTQGYGTTNPSFAYPAQLKMKLTEAMPGTTIHVFNKGIGGQDAEIGRAHV